MTNPDDRAAIEAMADAFVGKLTDSDAEAGIWATAALAALRDAGFWVERWRPIGEAEPYKESRQPILARFYTDLVVRTGRDDLNRWAGRVVTLQHGGFYDMPDQPRFDGGWNVAAPVGHGGIPDEWIECWTPLPPPPPAPRDD